jgi:hypothetical protein
MLYSSTTHTANLLVQGADVWKAEELLRVSEDDEDENDLDTPNPACLALDEDVAAPPAPA